MSLADKHRRINGAPEFSLPTQDDQETKNGHGEYVFETFRPDVNGYSKPYDNSVVNWSSMVMFQPSHDHPIRVSREHPPPPKYSHIGDSIELMSMRYFERTDSRAPPSLQPPDGSQVSHLLNLSDESFPGHDAMQWHHETRQPDENIPSRELLDASLVDGRHQPNGHQTVRHTVGSFQAMPAWTEAPGQLGRQSPFAQKNRKRRATLRMTSSELSNDLQQSANNMIRPDSSSSSVPPGIATEPWSPPHPNLGPGNQNSFRHAVFWCKKCDADFRTYDELSKHILLHTHPHECLYGCRRFKHRKDLERHCTVHSDERPFLCPYKNCKYARLGFKRRDNRKSHVNTMHTGSQPEEPESGDGI